MLTTIVKYETESALNNIREYSIVKPRVAAGSFGFTSDEVKNLCQKYGMDYDEMAAWYDGYQIGDEPSIFNPNSVMNAINSHECSSFWAATGAFTQVADYINMNYEGLKDDVVRMLAGGRCQVDVTGFVNNMSEVRSKDYVFTVLIHLGYLAYNAKQHECYIPNREVRGEMIDAVESNNWREIADVIQSSKSLLEATWAGDADKVAKMVDAAHDENTSILSYNDENSLSCVLSLAYIYARNEYVIHRELATGKGFADLVFIPRKFTNRPAIVVELKCDKDADTAIGQIHRKNYPAKVAEYFGTTSSKGETLILVGINYDKDTRTHTCIIETVCK